MVARMAAQRKKGLNGMGEGDWAGEEEEPEEQEEANEREQGEQEEEAEFYMTVCASLQNPNITCLTSTRNSFARLATDDEEEEEEEVEEEEEHACMHAYV